MMKRLTLSLLSAFLVSGLSLSAQSQAHAQDQARDARQLVVMTSYPDEVVSRFESAFEQAFPQYQLRVLWRSSEDAQQLFANAERATVAGVDVYWAPSPRNFAQFSQQGLFQPLDTKHLSLPEAIGNTQLRDVNGFYTASEVAAYGFVFNPEVLAREGLQAPQDWTDLLSPDFAGLLSVPAPTVGFAPVMIDIVLQSYGWDAGWKLWSEMMVNANMARRGASFIQDELQTGDSAVGITIDFFAASAIAGGAALDFIYPAQNGLNPAHIAVLRDTDNKEAADAFVDFVLSTPGQILMAHPDIRKLPVNPDAYQQLPADYHNPFAAAEQGGYRYDSTRGQPRLRIIAALFEQMLVSPQPGLTELWRSVQQAEHSGKDMSAVRALLATPVISEADADRLATVFSQASDNDAALAERDRLLVQWQQQISQQYDQVAGML